MQIKIKKGYHSLSILSCTREDGTYTSGRLQHGMEYHDLAHYVVEKTLDFDQGFYGLVCSGDNIEDFGLPRNIRPEHLMPKNLPLQSIQTEYIVNQLMLMTLQNNSDGFIATLDHAFTLANIPYPHNLNESTLQIILGKYGSLIKQWEALNENDSISFTF